MAQFIESHPDRLFPAEPNARSVTRILYNEIKDLPIISPHGHTDPSWFAENKNFTEADKIRDELKEMGIEIEDTTDGAIWRSQN